MAVRVADPNRLRIAGLIVTVLGVAWIVLGSTRGALLLIGLPLLSLGVGAWDLAHEGRASHRQLGLMVAIVGGGLALWSFFVIMFLGVLDEGRAGWTWYALLLVGLTMTIVGIATRLRPQLLAGAGSAVAGLAKGMTGRRSRAGRHAAPSSRVAISRREGITRGA